MSTIKLTINGEILSTQHVNGEILNGIPAYVLGKTLMSMQSSVNRAHISISRGYLGKNDRMRRNDYALSQFYIYNLEQNCISFNLIGKNGLVTKICNVLDRPYESAKKNLVAETERLASEAQNLISSKTEEPKIYNSYVETSKKLLKREFEHRSILKEIDFATQFVRSKHYGDSNIELTFTDDITKSYFFDKRISSNFGKIINQRSLSSLVEIECFIKDILDTQCKAKIEMIGTQKMRTLLFKDKEHMKEIYPHDINKQRRLICAPVFEYGSYDFDKGDLYYIAKGEDDARH